MRSSFGIHLMRYSTHLPTSYPKRFPKTRPPFWESRPRGSMTAPRVNVLHSIVSRLRRSASLPSQAPPRTNGRWCHGWLHAWPPRQVRQQNSPGLPFHDAGQGQPSRAQGWMFQRRRASMASTAPPTRREWIDTHICPCVLGLRTSPNGAW